MRTLGLSLLFGILCCIPITAQVKIGDNPQTIDPAAVLELESTTMALIITRVNTEQMEAITPGQGAIIYNTDAQCVHYYDGTQWVNLCEGASINVTTDPIVNPISTIVLTETAAGNNLEVAPNSIRTEQIVDGGIFGEDINDNSIGANKLARNSVTKIALSENAVGPFAIDRDSLPLSFFINDVPFLTAGDLSETVSTDAGNALTVGTDEGAFYDEQPVLDAIAANATAIADDLDGNPENEVQNLSLTGNLLTLSNPTGADDEIDLSGFAGTPNATDELITNAVLTGTDLIITEGGNDTTVSLADIVSTQVVDGTTLTGVGSVADPFKIEPSTVNGQFLSTNATGNVVWASVPTGIGTVATDGLTIVGDGSATPLSVPDAGITPIKIEPSAVFGQVLTTDAGGNVAWATVAGGGSDDQDASEVPYDNTTSLLAATDAQAAIDELAAAGGTDDQNAGEVPYDNTTSLLTAVDTQAAIDELAAAGGTDDQNAGEVPYDNTTSLLAATDAQAAIDEIAAAGGSDDQDDSEVPLQTPTDFDGNLTDETTVQEALNALNLNSTDDQDDSEVPLQTPTDFDGDLTDETTVQEALNALNLNSTDDQDDSEVPLQTPTDFDGDLTDETTVQEALNALNLNSTDDQDDSEVPLQTPTDFDGDLTDETTVQEALNALNLNSTDDQDDSEVPLQTPTDFDGDLTDETTVQEALNAIAAADSDNQNITGSNLTGETLTIGIQNGTNEDVDLSDFALDSDVAAAITASAALDNDTNSTNEIQTITSTDGSVTITSPSANDYNLSVTGTTGTSGSIFFANNSTGALIENNNQLFWDQANNRLGVGTNTALTNKLTISGTTRTSGLNNSPGTAGLPSYRFSDDSDMGMYRAAANQLAFSTNGTEAIRIIANQDVGIGLTPLEKLHVDGNIRADGDFISSNTAIQVPDYVFETYYNGFSSRNKTYGFKTLQEIEAFVKTNKHLPGIQSADEIKQTGKWNLTNASLINLEKIEELYLHTIEQAKQIDQLKSENQSLSAELKSLKKDITEIRLLLQAEVAPKK